MMNQESVNAGRTASLLAQHVVNELRKSGTKAWAGLPTPDELRQLQADRAESDFQRLKGRADAKSRRLEQMKQAVKRKLKGQSNE